MVYMILLMFVIVILVMSLSFLWKTQSQKKQYLSLDNLLVLVFTYVIMLVGFGLIYVLVELVGYSVLNDQVSVETHSIFHVISTKMYFSAVTLLSVGYGDITPVGAGRWIAMTEALIGYILPAAFVVRTVIDIEK